MARWSLADYQRHLNRRAGRISAGMEAANSQDVTARAPRPDARRQPDAVYLLPLPPSLNGMYGTNWETHRRFKTAAAREFYKLGGWEVARQRKKQSVKSFTTPVAVVYHFPRRLKKDGTPSKAKADVFNREKAVSDLLVKMGVLSDDSLIMSGTVLWAAGTDRVLVEIFVS